MHKGLVIGGIIAVFCIIALGATVIKNRTRGESVMTNEITQMDNLNTLESDIALIASATATGDMKTLTQVLNIALDNGMTVNQGKEILVQLYAYCGFPRALNAITNYMNVINDRESRGIYDTIGVAPTVLAANADKNKIGEQTREHLSGAPVSGPVFEFAPAIDDFLKEHLFADIFARGVLTEQQREIATISTLASMTGVDGQLASHIGIGKNIGLTDGQIADIINIARRPRNIMFGFGTPNALRQYFTGETYLAPITTDQVPMFNVTFEPGVRNNWHIHHGGGQILLATHGRGWYQEWGKEPQELHPGDAINIAPGVKHWHGAARDSWFTHIAVEVPSENGHAEWQEPVTDEEYNRLK